MRCVLVDASNLFLIHYSANTAIDSNGAPVGGAVGFINALYRITEILKPNRVYVVWDGPGGSTKKRQIFKEYKEGRRPTAGRHYEFANDEEQKKNKNYQMKLLRSAISSLPVCEIVSEHCEADDVIAYLVNSGEYFGHRSNILVTCDKDYLQLVKEKTFIYNPISKKLFDDTEVLVEYGVHPNNWLFYRSITGDPSDNIKGVKGIGPVRLAKLFPITGSTPLSPENILNISESSMDAKEWKKSEKNYQLIKENIDIIERNWKLMSLKDPLLSMHEKNRITQLVNDFKPSTSYKDLVITLMGTSGINLNPSFIEPFLRLQ